MRLLSTEYSHRGVETLNYANNDPQLYCLYIMECLLDPSQSKKMILTLTSDIMVMVLILNLKI